MIFKTRILAAAGLFVVFSVSLSAAPPPPPGWTPQPVKCGKVLYHAMLSSIGSIKPATPGATPAGPARRS